MTKNFSTSALLKKAVILVSGMLISVSAYAAGGGNLKQSGIDLDDRASLQRGAQLYMNYCSACHSLKYMRYSRIGEDLGLTEEEVMQNLNFTGVNYGEQIHTNLTEEQGNAWFGKMPPDLSVISRVRGSDWIYTYLHSFYQDESRPLGWNNTVFANASMPNPFWELQGLQRPVYGKKNAAGEIPVEKLVIAHAGSQTPEQFDQTVKDITAFLEYVGEPAGLKRPQIGLWVILFLAVFTLLAWLLEKEYWKDVH